MVKQDFEQRYQKELEPYLNWPADFLRRNAGKKVDFRREWEHLDVLNLALAHHETGNLPKLTSEDEEKLQQQIRRTVYRLGNPSEAIDELRLQKVLKLYWLKELFGLEPDSELASQAYQSLASEETVKNDPRWTHELALFFETIGKKPRDLDEELAEEVSGIYEGGFLNRRRIEESELDSRYNDRVKDRYYGGKIYDGWFSVYRTWFKREDFDYDTFLFDLQILDKIVGAPKKEVVANFIGNPNYQEWPELEQRIRETFGQKWGL